MYLSQDFLCNGLIYLNRETDLSEGGKWSLLKKKRVLIFKFVFKKKNSLGLSFFSSYFGP
jgi:hypothetical protein